jgi:hypothetical protein
MACMIPMPFVAGGNQSYLEFWTITGDLWYIGYLTLTVGPKPSNEQVAGAGHSPVGKIGTHMLLQALPLVSAARLWG